MDENPDTTKTNSETNQSADGLNGGEEQSKATKTYTQDEVNEFVRKRVNEINAKNDEKVKRAVADALAEQERQSKLSDEQKADEALKQRNAAIEKREREVTLRERRSEAMTTLIEKEIPAELVDYVVDVDADKTAENIDKLASAWNKAMEAKLKEKLAGTTPKDRSTGSNATKTAASNGVYTKNGVSAF